MKARPGLKILEIDKQNITMANNYRIFVEKYPEFQVEAASLRAELNENLQLDLKSLRLLNVYDLFGFTPELLEKSRYSVFGEIVTDNVTDECDLTGTKYIAVEFLPGQFDQRAASAVDCVHLIDPKADVHIKSSKLIILQEKLTKRQSQESGIIISMPSSPERRILPS